ncbi:MAG: A/G-specific adenine glycosylase [Desulfuromonadales bacterium]|nr:MAG: A/G-specific adenine glycosylase [Desulfuromonadales bacterium]
MNRIDLLRKIYADKGLTREAVLLCRQIVCEHYRKHGRSLPWRETLDPYAILVSEVMLQQTQVDRVKGRFETFIATFPDFRSLATAPLEAVLTEWQGLGYNRRALNLKRCAQAVVEQHGGTLPSSISDLEKLPGIGSYTARAVATFAFNLPSAFIETNIRAVFIHLLFPDQLKVHDRELLPLVAETLDRNNPREWYNALMDYGVSLKKLHGNPARRSAHHARQSPFKGSNRELRSQILKVILEDTNVTLSNIARKLQRDDTKVRRILEQLQEEGFIVVQNERFSVP